jgi:2-phosphoglycerate kinase
MEIFPYLVQENERTDLSYHARFIQDKERKNFRGCTQLLLIHSPRDIHQRKFHKRETPKSPRVAKISVKYFKPIKVIQSFRESF